MDLVAFIKDAFSEAELPGDYLLFADDDCNDLERENVHREFAGKHWQDVPFETLRREYSALTFFAPDGFRFFMPAFLTASVARYDDSDMIPGSIVSLLSVPPTDDADWRLLYETRMSSFSRIELEAICSVLVYLQNAHGEDFLKGQIKFALECVRAYL
jgi:hypothetical protein